MKLISAFLFLITCSLPIILAEGDGDPQESPPPVTFKFGTEIGYTSLPTADASATNGWQRVVLAPEIGVGKFGVGLNLDFNFRFNGGATGDQFEINPEDWIPSTQRAPIDLILSKFRYIRYGEKGEPIYALVGNIENGTLGNGFIVGGYNNTLFQPGLRIAGINFDLDGALFKFPFVGVESMFGNLGHFYQMGGYRVYVRPLADLPKDDPLRTLQLGFTMAWDSNPHLYGLNPSVATTDQVLIYGGDVRMPFKTPDWMSFAIFSDVASQNYHIGFQAGFGGNLAFFDYLFALRFLGPNFLPTYFDASYDLYRETKLAVYQGTVSSAAYNGWQAKIGVKFGQDKPKQVFFRFGATLEAPFTGGPSGYDSPNLRGDLKLRVMDFALDGWYEKQNITSLAKLFSPEQAVIGARVSYKFGPAVVGLVYDIRYDPNSTRTDSSGNIQKWLITSRIETAISVTAPEGEKLQ